MHFNVEPLPGRPEFGAIVRDLAPESLSDPATRKALYDLWIDRGLIIFKKMEGINTHLELSSVFGEPEEHPLLRGVDMPREHKLIIDIADGIDVRRDGTIDYESDESDVYEIDGELRAAFLPWHTDLVYVDEINHGGIIRPVTLPKNDGRPASSTRSRPIAGCRAISPSASRISASSIATSLMLRRRNMAGCHKNA